MVFDQKEYNKKYYQENKEKIAEQWKKYYQENKEKRKEYNKKYHIKYYQENKESRKRYSNNYRQENKEKIKEQSKKYQQKNKEIVYNHYSHGVIQCACCGEKEIDFLSLDHIYNNGAEHRKKSRTTTLVCWAIKNNFPPIFQLLCMNCNFSKGKKGNNCKCIHQIRREEKEKRKQEEEKE